MCYSTCLSVLFAQVVGVWGQRSTAGLHVAHKLHIFELEKAIIELKRPLEDTLVIGISVSTRMIFEH